MSQSKTSSKEMDWLGVKFDQIIALMYYHEGNLSLVYCSEKLVCCKRRNKENTKVDFT